MAQQKNLVALDCGNSSFRIVLGRYDGNRLTMEVVDQYPNDMVHVGEYDYWDFLRIYEGFLRSLKKAASMVERIDSIGVCTWGVDFGLFDARGNLLSNPLSYRNAMGAEQLERLSHSQHAELFSATGILCDKINSVYLLTALRERMPELYATADKLLMAPDILNFMLTGVMANEPSELSTTQLLDARTRRISPQACAMFGIPERLFCPIPRHGERIGMLRPALREQLGLAYDIPVVCVPSHDTAAAVLAIPASKPDFAFISSGTWSLIGTELAEPVLTPQVLEAGLTNEVGAFGRITLLKNSAGMFLIQRIKKEYEQELGREAAWAELDALAAGAAGEPLLLDCNSPRFFNPPSMSGAIRAYLRESGQAAETPAWGQVVRAVYESMACGYAQTIAGLERACGNHFEHVYIVGGGSKNSAVNKATAQRTGKTVVACGKESTSLGCLATQLKYLNPSLGAGELRQILARSVQQTEYPAGPGGGALLERWRSLPA